MRLIVIASSLLCCLCNHAATLCVSVAGAGSANGADWNNSLAQGFTPVRGNTYLLADGNYDAKGWSAAASGTTTITVSKATVTSHGTDTGWSDTMGDGTATFVSWTFSTSYWQVDGVVGGGPLQWDTNHGFAVNNSTVPLCTIDGDVTDITVQRVRFYSDRGATFIAGVKSTTGSATGVTFSRCSFVDIFGPPFHISNWTNTVVELSYIHGNKSTPEWHSEGVSSIGYNLNCVWRWNLWDQIEGTAVFAGVNNGTSDGWQIYGNVISRSTTPMFYYWEDPGSNKNMLTNSFLLNNTIVSSMALSQGGFQVQNGGDNVARNNLFYGNSANSFVIFNIDHDYSFAADNIREGTIDKDSDIVGTEANGQEGSGSPFLSSIADPISATWYSDTEQGVDTTALVAGNATDMFGRRRGAGGVYARGANEYPASTQRATIGRGTIGRGSF